MTPIAQLIAELRDDVAELEGSAASGRKVVTDECVDRIRRAAEALARQEELLAEALADFEAIAGRENECGNSQWDPKEGRWQPIRDMARRAAARLSDKLKGE